MPRLSTSLTDIQIRNSKPKATPYKLADGRGLYLLVQPTGSRHWRFRYRMGGRENMFAIGAYPEVNLAAARRECELARSLVTQGHHPSHARQRKKDEVATDAANTFQAVAKEWIKENKTTDDRLGWSDYYCSQVEGTLAKDVYPEIGNLPIRKVTAAHILAIIKRVSTRKTRGGKVGAPTVALLIRQWCSAIFRYASPNLMVDGDPAAVLKGAVRRPRVQHKNALEGKSIV
ncbi:MAG: integrase arm-type DNA-binding domain-containing protein, partial [Rudaea sp.]